MCSCWIRHLVNGIELANNGRMNVNADWRTLCEHDYGGNDGEELISINMIHPLFGANLYVVSLPTEQPWERVDKNVASSVGPTSIGQLSRGSWSKGPLTYDIRQIFGIFDHDVGSLTYCLDKALSSNF